MKVAVIGGGVSGIRASLTLARAGVSVTLFEKNQHLGGRVFSFRTPDFGEVDIGQHIWLRACTAFEELLRDLAVPDDWIHRQDRLAMTYRWPDGAVRTLAAGRLPGRLALLPILWHARVGLGDKFRLLWGSFLASLYSQRSLEALDNISFADWLHSVGQSPAAIEWFWEPLVVGVCNGRLAEVSARYGLFTVRESLLKSGAASAICFFRRPLSEVLDRHARQVLTGAGVEVLTGAIVNELRAGSPVLLRAADGQPREFDRVILATPLNRIRGLLPDQPLPAPLAQGAIAGLLLRYAAPVMDEFFFTAVGSPVQIVFNKSAIWARNQESGVRGQGSGGADSSLTPDSCLLTPGQVIELVISAAEREVKLGVEKVAAELLPELAKLLPRVKETPLLAKRLLVHATATFRVSPGADANRLPMALPFLENVFFAGDHTATGWPSTMESATRAGLGAAQAALKKGSGME
ncbi:MAG: FAD-dependent oxidoreductase [Gemmataceae bacterium]|nr:FAD-dependent oxidoreductase [Gemmataceae bacterium]